MFGKIISFLFDSVYQVVTWIWIAVSISSFFFFAGKPNGGGKGMALSVVSLCLATIVMIALLAKKTFWDDAEGKKRTERPELYISGAMMLPLEAGKPETVLLGLKNRGKVTARNIRLGGSNHVFSKADFGGPLVYKPVPIQNRPDLGPGKEENSLISKSPQPLSQERIRQLENEEVLFFHFAEGDYDDDDGNTYPIDFCYMFNPTSPTILKMCPEKYWPKSRAGRRGTPSLDTASGVDLSSPAPSVELSKTDVSTSKGIRVPEQTADDRAPFDPYDGIKWTDYTEDYFGGAIWRWNYRPEMGDKEPRNIRSVCPDCGAVLPGEMHSRKRDSAGLLMADFICVRHNPIKWFHFKTGGTDPLEPIRVLIRQRLETGEWEDVVKRQSDVREGRV